MKNRLALCLVGAALCAAGPAFAGDGTNLIKMIPAESQIVLVFDVADARDSALLQKGYDSLLAAKPDAKAKLTEIGLDPMKDIDTVLFAGSPKGDEFDDMQNMVIIVEGRIPKDKLATVPGVKASKYAGTTIWSKGDTDVAVLGDRLFFTKVGKMKAALDLAVGKGKAKALSAATSPKGKKLRDALAATDTTTDLWMTVLIPDKAKADMKAQGMSADVVSVGVNFTADIATAMRIVTDSDATAGKIVTMAQGQLAQISQAAGSMGLAKAAKSLMISQDKAKVNISLTLTEAELNSLMNLAGLATGAGGSKPPSTAPARSTPGSLAPPTTGTKPRTP
jgi:hypothetical protein